MSKLFGAVALCVASSAALAAPPTPDPTGVEQHVFESALGQHPNLTYEQLVATLPAPAFVEKLSFDPTKAKHFEAIAKHLGLDAAARAKFAQTGVLSVHLDKRYSMGSAYQDIYMSDLPVLVTTDSILHAMHRSFDEALAEIEGQVFLGTMRDLLMDARERLKVANKDVAAPVGQALHDAELYITVTLNLFRGAGAPAGDQWSGWDGTVKVVSALGQDAAVLEILKKIQAADLEQRPATSIYGGQRAVDWSQFVPRGHYTKSPDLQAYFRGMMWLGRADTGFNLTEPPAGGSGDPQRERRAAAALALAMKASGADDRMREIDRIIAFMVGTSDNLGVDPLNDLLARAGIKHFGDVANDKKDAALKAALEATGLAAQRIRSQVVVSYPQDPNKVAPPALFQMFGQRFLVDSFVLSQVVYDSIMFEGAKQQRMMPTGLDVMAALGNDEALRLLKDELEKWRYGSNLAAARAVVDAYPDAGWKTNLYQRWLAALRTLDDLPADKAAAKNVPEAMRTQAWARKMLRTQLGSWAELRHDTILYGKQSYSASVGCEYPAGYVEPYPALYAGFAEFSAAASGHLLRLAKKKGAVDARAVPILERQAAFWAKSAGLLKRLEGLAKKELAGKPFASADLDWIKKTIDKRGGGSGPPRYDGWYTELFYITHPDKWAPTVADVHTDPDSKRVLEVAVGDAELLVVAVDNQGDKAVYVGPSYSFYEWAEPNAKRLTDEEWQARIHDGTLPAQPTWTDAFVR